MTFPAIKFAGQYTDKNPPLVISNLGLDTTTTLPRIGLQTKRWLRGQ